MDGSEDHKGKTKNQEQERQTRSKKDRQRQREGKNTQGNQGQETKQGIQKAIQGIQQA